MNSTHDELKKQVGRSGRRAGSPDTRGEIAAAAGRLFAERGYDRTSMRAIAAEAGVDPALVTHYFGSKQRLFVSIVQLPIDPALVVGLAAGGADGAGERLARTVIGVLESPAGRERATGIVRAAASEPEAAALLREQLAEQLFGPVARELGTDEPELRANLCGSQMVGLVMAPLHRRRRAARIGRAGPRRTGDRARVAALPHGRPGVVGLKRLAAVVARLRFRPDGEEAHAVRPATVQEDRERLDRTVVLTQVRVPPQASPFSRSSASAESLLLGVEPHPAQDLRRLRELDVARTPRPAPGSPTGR